MGADKKPPSASEVPTGVKLEAISIARKWPLYFCRLFPVMEIRGVDKQQLVPVLLGVSETGIRLLELTHRGGTEILSILEHFELKIIFF
jgi:hypothetical protein